LEEARRRYRFVVHGYVVMPEHFHLLITEPDTLHAPEPGQPRPGSKAGPVGMEQFPGLLLWRNWLSKSKVPGVAIGDQIASRGDLRCTGNDPTHSHRTRMSGAPGTGRATL
jgi:REP element-mobilizing transposase RayT